jgi:hypothetical protein
LHIKRLTGSEDVGLLANMLKVLAELAGGRGCVVRNGNLVAD